MAPQPRRESGGPAGQAEEFGSRWHQSLTIAVPFPLATRFPHTPRVRVGSQPHRLSQDSTAVTYFLPGDHTALLTLGLTSC